METFEVLKQGNEKSSSIDCARKVRCYMSHKRVFGRCTLMTFFSLSEMRLKAFNSNMKRCLLVLGRTNTRKESKSLIKLKTILEMVWKLIRVIAQYQFKIDSIPSSRIHLIMSQTRFTSCQGRKEVDKWHRRSTFPVVQHISYVKYLCPHASYDFINRFTLLCISSWTLKTVKHRCTAHCKPVEQSFFLPRW